MPTALARLPSGFYTGGGAEATLPGVTYSLLDVDHLADEVELCLRRGGDVFTVFDRRDS